MLMNNDIKAAIEALLFASGEQIGSLELSEALHISEVELRQIIEEMIGEYQQLNRGIQILIIDGGYSLATKPEFAPIVATLMKPQSRRFSPAAMETMAIIAYRQPITKAEIEQLRGVKSDRTIAGLLEKGIIQEAGKKNAPGKPVLFGTTHEFLKIFKLSSLQELPQFEDDG